MDYEAVRVQVLALLQQEQRLSYRVLKRQLQLDDDTLEDLKEDFIYAKKLAVDEDGRVLVWIGAPGTSHGERDTVAPQGAGAMRMLNYGLIALSAFFIWPIASMFCA